MTRESWPVIISGCGPVGMTLANLLGQYGVRTLVVEEREELVDHPRAVGVDSDCLRVWQAVGLHDELLEDMTPMGPDGLGMVYLDRDRQKFLEVRPKRCDYGFAFGYGFIQPLADRILLAGLNRYPAVEVRFGQRVQSVEQDDGGVTLHVAPSRSDPSTETREIRGHFAVACDGGRSRLRKDLGISMQGKTYEERWLVIDTLEPQGPDRNTQDVQIHCDPTRTTVSVPRKHGHRRWEFWAHDHEKDEELLQSEFIRSLLARYTNPDEVSVRRKLVYRFNARTAEQFRAGRVFLTGDAAHVTPPFAAQGLAMGVRDAFNLAWKIALVVNGKANATLLDTYERERLPLVRATIRLATNLGRIMTPRSNLQGTLVPAAIRLLRRSRALDEKLREGGPKPKPRYSRGFLAKGCGMRTSLAGRPLHQPWVTNADGKRERLDHFLGSGFALIGWGTNPADYIDYVDNHRETLIDGLGIRVLEIVSRESRVGDQIIDVEGQWEAWLGPPGDRVLLVRPDRFIAVDCRGRELREQLTRLSAPFGAISA